MNEGGAVEDEQLLPGKKSHCVIANLLFTSIICLEKVVSTSREIDRE
jgi:hypothetical protein